MSSIVPTEVPDSSQVVPSPSEEQPSASATPSPSPSPSPSPTPSQSPSAQPSSQAPPSSSQQPEPESSSVEPEPSSSQQQQSSQQPSSVQPSSSTQPSSSVVPSSSAAPESSAVQPSSVVPSTSEQPSTSAAPSSISSSATSSEELTAPTTLTNTFTSTDGNGKLYTITQTIRNGNTGGQSSAADGGNTSFLENTGAVAGTFVAVGLVVTAAVMAFIVFMLKRRRRQRLDRDVATAAAAAAAAASHKGYDDEDDNGPAMTQYGGYYSTNGMEVLDHPQPRMDYDYEDPAGGYDHYANSLSPGDRMSTATAPGMAGFGAHSAQQNYASNDGYPSNDQAFDGVTHDAQQDGSNGNNAHHRPSNGYYFDPNQAYDYAADDNAYGGAQYDDQALPRPSHHRSGSEGSVSRGDDQARGLTITNV